MNLLVTGGSGFIGSHFIEEIFKKNDVTKLYNLDADTYAANKNLPFESDARYRKLTFDISDPQFFNQKSYTNKKVDWNWFEYVSDRKGHDFRYAINIQDFLSDFPHFKLSDFEENLKQTVQSYL